jgi:hypothetical protein
MQTEMGIVSPELTVSSEVRTWAVTLSIAAFGFGCAPHPEHPPMSRAALAYLESLRPEHAALDAKKAAARRDCRVLAVGGWGVVPLEASQRFGVREIVGTGDMLYGAEYNRLNFRAARYANAYNSAIAATPPCVP